MLKDKKILLIISGGISAYKSLELIRLIRKNNGSVTCILTKGGEHFVTPLSVSSLSENKVYCELWSLTDEAEMGHIRLSRENDLIVIAPASADFIAKMANGLAGDLATTTLLATNKPILVAPAMNPEMWSNRATQDNIIALKDRDISFIGPEEGEMACGETGLGRMSEPEDIFKAIKDFFFDKPLNGTHALVTAGPTYEPIDPVRFLGNRSSGIQGYAIAKELEQYGAKVTLVSGPTNLKPLKNVETINIETAQEMLDACTNSLPAQICVCSAAVSDWKPENQSQQKIKKSDNNESPSLSFTQTPDILFTISNHKTKRPDLVIGFAAETQNIQKYARDKLERKRCNWILANHVGKDALGNERAFGSDENKIYFITNENTEEWEYQPKKDIAKKLVNKIIEHINYNKSIG